MEFVIYYLVYGSGLQIQKILICSYEFYATFSANTCESGSLDFAIKILFSSLNAFIGPQNTESIFLVRVFTHAIRLHTILGEMKEPLDFT